MQHLEAKLVEIHQCVTSSATQKKYLQKQVEFVLFLNQHQPKLLAPGCAADRIQNDKTKGCPIRLDLLSAHHIELFLVSLGASSRCSARSAISDMFRTYHIAMPEEMNRSLRTFFQAAKRHQSLNSAHVRPGKSALEMSLYRFLATRLLASGDMFCHTYMVLTWNLLCRSHNTAAIHLSHLKWFDDALQVYFPRMKNDQAGERSAHPRHLYANPHQPETCVILALGIFFLCHPVEGVALFAGNDPQQRFLKTLKRLLRTDAVQKELAARGLSATEFGSHSLRKGAFTFTTTSPDAPPLSSIYWRCGWSLGKMHDTYFHYDMKGDQQVGRVAAAVPLATIAPRFQERDELVSSVLHTLFPQSPPSLTRVLEMSLASVVFHQKYLLDTLPQHHPLFSTAVFSSPGMLGSLMARVTLREIRQNLTCCKPEDDQKVAELPAKEIIPASCPVETLSYPSYFWGEASHRVSQDFCFPRTNVFLAWQEWMCGNTEKAYGPLRFLEPSDMSTRNLRKRLSDFRLVMRWVERQVKEREKWVPQPTLEQASEMYALVAPLLDKPNCQWISMVKKMGK